MAAVEPCAFALLQQQLKGKPDSEIVPITREYVESLIRYVAQIQSQYPGDRFPLISPSSNIRSAIKALGEVAVAPLAQVAAAGAPAHRLAALYLLSDHGAAAVFAYEDIREALREMTSDENLSAEDEALFWKTAAAMRAINPISAESDVVQAVGALIQNRRDSHSGEDQGSVPEWAAYTAFVSSRLNALKIGPMRLLKPFLEAESLLSSYRGTSLPNIPLAVAHLRASILRTQIKDGEPRELARQMQEFVDESAGMPLLKADLDRIRTAFGWPIALAPDLCVPFDVQVALERLVEKLVKDIGIQIEESYGAPEACVTLLQAQEGLTRFVESLNGARICDQEVLRSLLKTARAFPYMTSSMGLADWWTKTKSERIGAAISTWCR